MSFDIMCDSDYLIEAIRSKSLPEGWTLDETIQNAAYSWVIFDVVGVPTVEAGQEVARIIHLIEWESGSKENQV